ENFGWLSPAFDPTSDGTYSIYLAAFDQAGRQVTRSDITVVVGDGGATVPEPASLALVGIAACGLAVTGRRRRNRA
ncbi:MAG: PEP-CTERM sorting domain-containing protein, partial [Rubrivivax sp.]